MCPKPGKMTQAFTLIEFVVVMAIIGIIAGMIVSVGGAARRQAKEAKAKAMISGLEVAISMYRSDVGSWPPDDSAATGSESLYEHLTDTAQFGPTGTAPITGWRGPYMEFKESDLNNAQSAIVDPWDNLYQYIDQSWFDINRYAVWSMGQDGQDDSSDGNNDYDDDIGSWQ